MTNIVQVNVSQQQGPTPSTLQRTGAFISQGGTTLTSGAYSLLTGLSSLTPLLHGALSNSALAWASSVVTVTTTAPHGFTVADTIQLTIAGALPSGYNGVYTATITGASTFTYPLVTNPGTATAFGSYTPEDVSELLAMGTTFFGQGNQNSVYVLELGAGNATDGTTALQAWITANPGIFYSYLCPRAWGVSSAVISFVAGYESNTSKTYFHITTTLASYTSFTPLMKCVLLTIEAPTVAAAALLGTATEFSAAAGFYDTLANNPSSASMVPPSAFSYLYGVTPYPTQGNSALLATLKAAAVNIIGTGAEGGISNTIWLYGTTMDGNDFTYWYSVDSTQINLDLNTANAVINGSNNPQAPLYYNQPGVDRLETVAVTTMRTQIAYGLALGQLISVSLPASTFSLNQANGLYSGQVVVNAVPFSNYVGINQGDYQIGKYAGLQVAYTPARGFLQIVYNVTVSNFVTQ